MDNRRLLLAAALSMAVLFGWQLLFAPEKPRDAAPAPRQTSDSVAPEKSSTPSTAPVAEPAAAEAATAAVGGDVEATPVAETASEPPLEATSVERVVLENGEVRAELTNRGAELVSFQLKGHLSADHGAVDLVRRREEGPYLFAFADREEEPLPLDQALFTVERTPGRPEAVFRYRGPLGAASKTFTLRPDGFLDVSAEVAGVEGWSLLVGPGVRNPSPEEVGNRFNRRGAVYLSGGEVKLIDAQKTEETELVPGSGLSWAGLQDTYFLIALLPEKGLDEVRVTPVGSKPAGAEEEVEELRLAPVASGASMELSAYLGPKQYDRLHALGHGLDETINFGMFGILSRPLLLALRWIHDHVVANYGWAIILLTVCIRLVLFPLNHKSIVSMRKMQKVQPKVQAIQRKWRPKLKDKQGRPNREAQMKMNQEVMDVYKVEGVNPAAGCLPMLLQMPVLFAFYRLLYNAIELRNAPWIGWIHDLSARDPYYVLPLIMGASMLAQQRLTPSSADPMQRRLFMLMPIVFTIFFLGFPTGLVLYWLTNNVLAIVQQLAYNRFRESQAAEG
ncbi:MAG: membrane protein insertase YidC [Thermoanaerobaculia bacterium]